MKKVKQGKYISRSLGLVLGHAAKELPAVALAT
jgi:uncharacterized membrane protein SpoIIM required for sporulation